MSQQTNTSRRGARLIGGIALVGLAAAIAFVEFRHPITHFRLLSFATAFLFLSVATALMPVRLRSGCLVLAALVFGLVLVESLAVALEPKADLTATANYEIDEPILGWDNGPAGVYHARRVDPATGAVIYDVTYTIDAHHNRFTRSAEDGRALVFLGDSFTFGDGVNDADTMPQRFADLLDGKQRVVNLSVSGFSPSQVLRELQTGLKDISIGPKPAAFVMLTGSFHIVRTACKESWTIPAPRYEMRDGRLVFVGACAEGARRLFRRFLEETATYRVFVKPFRLRLSQGDVETFIEIVADVARTAKAKYGVELLVPYIGGPVAASKALHDKQAKLLPIWAYLSGSGYDDESIVAELRKRGVKVVDMTLRDEAMEGHLIGIPGDGHPTPFANTRRAMMTLDALKSLGVRFGPESAPASARN